MKQGELYYSGTIVEIVDKVLYEIKVDIPGLKTGVTAYPMRGEVDEPRVGDFVFLKCLDPVFQSYYLYHKIKENDFIGFRSNGKMVDITPDYIQVAIFNPSDEEWNDFSENTSTPSGLVTLAAFLYWGSAGAGESSSAEGEGGQMCCFSRVSLNRSPSAVR